MENVKESITFLWVFLLLTLTEFYLILLKSFWFFSIGIASSVVGVAIAQVIDL